MGVPSTRTPVRVARGTYANLSTVDALAALQEGEICFATDEGKLYVKQGASLNGISASSQAQPVPGDVTASPAFASGTGTQADPYVITGGTSPFAGGTLESAQEITIANGTAGDLVLFTDQSVVASGDRFANQDVGTINSAGNYTFKLNYTDTPSTTTNNTTYNGVLQVGNVWFSWTVVQSDLAPLTEATATSIVSGGLAVGNTLTATAGTATGGTSPYTYAVRWQRSFNGTSGWFDTGATGTNYTIVQADAGYYVRAVATATDSTPGASGGPLTVDLASSSTAQINVNSLADITDVALSEDDPTGARYTSKAFSADATMNPEGVPTSSKAVKVKFSGTFVDYPSTDNVTAIIDTDPADAAVTPGPVTALSLDEITNGFSNGNFTRTSSFSYNSSYMYFYNNSFFLDDASGNTAITTFRNGMPNGYSYTPEFFGTTAYFINPIPSSRSSAATTGFGSAQYYYAANDTSGSYYYFWNAYKSTSGSSQNFTLKGYVRDSAGAIQGIIYRSQYNSLFLWPPTSSSTYHYELANSAYDPNTLIRAYGATFPDYPGWFGVNRSSGSYNRYQNTTYNRWRWWQNVHVVDSGTGWQLNNSNTYTDIDTDTFFNWNNFADTTGYLRHVEMGPGYDNGNGKYVKAFLYQPGNSALTRTLVVASIDYGLDPTVASNWTVNYKDASTLDSTFGTSVPYASQNWYMDTSGRLGVMYDDGTYLHLATTEDYGATWTYNKVFAISGSKNDVTPLAGNQGYAPWYYDGHWFYRGYCTYNGQTEQFLRSSNNKGASWNDVAVWANSSNSSVKNLLIGPSENSTMFGPTAHYRASNGYLWLATAGINNSLDYTGAIVIPYKTDLTLAGGTNLSNNSIRLNDTVRQGSTTGRIIEIDTGTNTISVDNTNASSFSTGSPLQNTVSHSGGTAGTVYGVVGGSGAVSDLQTSDPGFVTLGSNPNITLTLPATFPTGNTPDVELPAGTTMQVTVQATNSSGSDTLDSNIITPS